MNPGGSVKDRAALGIITDAEAGAPAPGGTIVEGTAGNTGIGLTVIGHARGYQTVIVIPETQSREKIQQLRTLGAEAHPCRPSRTAIRTTTIISPGGWLKNRAGSGQTSSTIRPIATLTIGRRVLRYGGRPLDK